MSSPYLVRSGDTYETISSRVYGDTSGAGEIQAANPGAVAPPQPGTTITIPDREPRHQASPAGDGVELRIAGTDFRGFTQIAITRRLDAVDTVEIEAPQADSEQFRNLIQPLTFQPLTVFAGGDQVFTGTLTHVQPSITADTSKVRLSGYSSPGVLSDCTVPAGADRQFRGMNLPDIATKVIKPFSLQIERSGEMGGEFRRVKMRPRDKVLSFLTGLAKQRKVFLGSTVDGKLALSGPPAVTKPVIQLRQGESPLKSIEPSFAPQSYYSHVTGFRKVNRGGVGSQTTVINPLLQSTGVLRPLSLEMRDIKRGELQAATEAKLGGMLADAVSYGVTVATWRDPQGVLWEPGTTVSLEAPKAFVYAPYDFQVRSVRFARRVDGGTVAKLNLVLPGVFAGEAPTMLPWS